MKPSPNFSRLVEIMAKLRDPNGGCPWDLEQDFRSIRHYTIEEAYEVADAIEREDFEDLKSELGDLLLQPVYHAQMAAEAGHFTIDEVVQTISEKLVRRHPHVFGNVTGVDTGDAVSGQWDAIKAEERDRRAMRRGEVGPPSLLDDVPQALPALLRAEKLSKRAAAVGFDWDNLRDVTAKVREELEEVEQAVESDDKDAVTEEIGDLLFAVANLARKLGIAPEAALSDANAKFSRRFRFVESRCSIDNIDPADAGLERLDGYWNEIRAAEKSGSGVMPGGDLVSEAIQET